MRHTSYPFARAFDADGDGAADLQTDVMRFMAIISMCLVAIFALVQSIPAEVPIPAPVSAPVPTVSPVTDQPNPTTAPQFGDSDPNEVKVTVPQPAVPQPVVESDEEVRVTVPEPSVPDPPETVSEPIQQASVAVRDAVVAESDEEVRVTVPELGESEQRIGFTLRFASDQALTALVAREDIGFYAIGSNSASRMQYDRGRVEFWQASVPKQYHEMHASTVPAAVRDALGRSGQPADVTWGVTLPARLSRELNRYLSRYSGGDLIIAANGTMARQE